MVVSGRKWITEDRTAVACCGGQRSNMDISRQNSSDMLWWSAVESGFQKTEQQWHVVVVSGKTWISVDRTAVTCCGGQW